jgi:inhibitor of cysteine peptidase
MFEKKYKADNERIEPTRESLLSLSYKMKREQAKKKDKKKAVRWIRPAAAVAAALVVLLGCFQIFRSLTPRDGQIPMAGAGAAGEAEVSQQQAQSPEDYSRVYAQIKELKEKERENGGDSDMGIYTPALGLDGIPEAGEENAVNTAGGGSPYDDSSAEKDYSDTNNQVEGVQEADIIKTDGEYIYAAVDGDVYLLRENGGNPEILSKIEKKAGTELDEKDGAHEAEEYVNNIYVTETRLVLMKYTVDYSTYEDAVAEDVAIAGCYVGQGTYTAAVYDIADRSHPVLLNELGQSGTLISSRMVGDILYLVYSYYVPGEIDETDPSTYVPALYLGDAKTEVAADDIMLLGEPGAAQYLTVSSIDVGSPAEFLDTQSILGCGSDIYCNSETLVVALTTMEETNDVSKDKTELFRFSLKDGAVTMESQGSVPGYVLNQFSMDEYNGYFRIVTTENVTHYFNEGGIASAEQEKTRNHLFVLDESMNIVGSIEDLARGESIYSARFMGDTGYFVTYRQVDPLFTVDLSTPSEPKILSELKVPGFSNYLHPFGDGLLLGFGQNSDEESGEIQGLKLSMFDTSDPAAVAEKHSELLGEKYMWSNAIGNHKAILVDSEKNLIGFPAENEYMLYSYSPKSGFQKITQLTLEADGPGDMDYDLRGFYVDDVFYLYSPSGLAAFSMEDFSRISTLLWEE